MVLIHVPVVRRDGAGLVEFVWQYWSSKHKKVHYLLAHLDPQRGAGDPAEAKPTSSLSEPLVKPATMPG